MAGGTGTIKEGRRAPSRRSPDNRDKVTREEPKQLIRAAERGGERKGRENHGKEPEKEEMETRQAATSSPRKEQGGLATAAGTQRTNATAAQGEKRKKAGRLNGKREVNKGGNAWERPPRFPLYFPATRQPYSFGQANKKGVLQQQTQQRALR